MTQQLQGIATPHEHDVLSGRGNFVNYHAGNEHFRALVRKHKVAYVACPKPQKGKFSKMIVDEIKSLNPPGRFLKQDPSTKLWHDIGEKKALDKTRQALREGAPEIMKDLADEGVLPVDRARSASPAPTRSSSSPHNSPRREQGMYPAGPVLSSKPIMPTAAQLSASYNHAATSRNRFDNFGTQQQIPSNAPQIVPGGMRSLSADDVPIARPGQPLGGRSRGSNMPQHTTMGMLGNMSPDAQQELLTSSSHHRQPYGMPANLMQGGQQIPANTVSHPGSSLDALSMPPPMGLMQKQQQQQQQLQQQEQLRLRQERVFDVAQQLSQDKWSVGDGNDLPGSSTHSADQFTSFLPTKLNNLQQHQPPQTRSSGVNPYENYSSDELEPRPIAPGHHLMQKDASNLTPQRKDSGDSERVVPGARKPNRRDQLKRQNSEGSVSSLAADNIFAGIGKHQGGGNPNPNLSLLSGGLGAEPNHGSSAHLSVMSLSISDMNAVPESSVSTDVDLLGARLDSSLKLRGASSSLKLGPKKGNSSTATSNVLDMSVATLGLSEAGEMSLAHMTESAANMSFSNVFDETEKDIYPR